RCDRDRVGRDGGGEGRGARGRRRRRGEESHRRGGPGRGAPGVTEGAPPGGSGVRSEAIGVLSRAAVGATGAFAALVAVGELLGVFAFFLTLVYGLWSCGKIGLLTALLSLRSELLVTIHSTPLLPPEAGSR